MTEQTNIPQTFEGEPLQHVAVGDLSRPTVILFPTVMGVSPLEIGFAERLCGLGYAGVVADLFGKEFHGADRDTMFGQMKRLREDRAALRRRLLEVFELVRGLAGGEGRRMAAIGYCFGGQCALDLARAGAELAGVASFHGLFDPPGLDPQPIKAKVIAFHGWDDPMVPPDAVAALGKELTEAGADWQIHAYGHVGHGFTNPNASSLGIAGVDYNETAARRSWASLEDYLAELFG